MYKQMKILPYPMHVCTTVRMSITFLFPAGCEEYDNTLFDTNNSTFGQAPGTELVLSCSRNMERDVTITCQEDGQWEPNPDDLWCIGIISLYN